jgi:3-oxoacyl-[acyl-carrier-protein] synthase II
MRRVVVTGIGATTPLGGDATSSWKALLEGKSGISTIEAEWVSKYELPVTFAGQAKVPSSEVLTPQAFRSLISAGADFCKGGMEGRW